MASESPEDSFSGRLVFPMQRLCVGSTVGLSLPEMTLLSLIVVKNHPLPDRS